MGVRRKCRSSVASPLNNNNTHTHTLACVCIQLGPYVWHSASALCQVRPMAEWLVPAEALRGDLSRCMHTCMHACTHGIEGQRPRMRFACMHACLPPAGEPNTGEVGLPCIAVLPGSTGSHALYMHRHTPETHMRVPELPQSMTSTWVGVALRGVELLAPKLTPPRGVMTRNTSATIKTAGKMVMHRAWLRAAGCINLSV